MGVFIADVSFDINKFSFKENTTASKIVRVLFKIIASP